MDVVTAAVAMSGIGDASSHTRLTVLISGSGTNLQALIDACNTPALPNTSIVRVISNKKDVKGLERAAAAGIPTKYHNLVAGGYKKRFPAPDGPAKQASAEARSAYDADLAKLVLEDKPDLVVCAGFMHIISGSFLQPLQEAHVSIINLHPSLPEGYPGHIKGATAIPDAHRLWLEGKIDKTGAMIHDVILEVDAGKPLTWVEIPFVKGSDENLDVFEEKFHKHEWQLIVEGTRLAIERLQAGHDA